MKKFIAPLALAASLFTLPSYAGELIIGATGFNGTLVTDFTNSFGSSNIAVSAENSELGGGLYFGFIWNVNSGFNVGIEGYYDFIDVTVSNWAGFSSQSLEDNVTGLGGIRMLPSFKITNNTEIYLELGLAIVMDTFTDPNSGLSEEKNISAFRYGAGTQTMIYDNISLRVYYSVIDQMAESSISTENYKLTAQPSMNEFGVGVAYHFQM
jgi:opacity protein-like surface antigen